MKRKQLLHKLIPLALCAALMATTAGAATPTAVANEDTAKTQANPTSVQVWGSITKLENGSIQVKNDSTEGINDIVLHINEDTLVLGAVDGMPISKDDLKDGDVVYAYASPAMTRSLPPQSNALLILGNIPADFRVPDYYQVTNFTMITTLMLENNIINATVETDQGETLSFSLTDKLDAEGNLQYLQTDGVTFQPYLTKNIVTVQDLIPGSHILVWRDYEGNPTKVMVFPYEYAGYLKVFTPDAIDVNGQVVEATVLTGADEVSYLPVRAVAEAAGFTVTWNNGDRSLTVLKDGAALFTYATGTETAKVNGDEAISVSPSKNQNGSVYMTAFDLTQLLNLYQAH